MSQDATVTFIDPCLDQFTFSETAQTSPGSDKFTGQQILFELNPFTITPTICEVTYACSSVARADNAASAVNCDDLTFDGVFNGDATDGQLTFSADSNAYENGVVTPGDYVVTITGTAVTSSDTKTATFTISMVDPCDPPIIITSPGLTDQQYTITD